MFSAAVHLFSFDTLNFSSLTDIPASQSELKLSPSSVIIWSFDFITMLNYALFKTSEQHFHKLSAVKSQLNFFTCVLPFSISEFLSEESSHNFFMAEEISSTAVGFTNKAASPAASGIEVVLDVITGTSQLIASTIGI